LSCVPLAWNKRRLDSVIQTLSSARLFLVITVLALAALPNAARADDPEPLPPDAYVLPYDGYHHPVSSWPNATNFEMFDFTIYADYEAGEFWIDVASSPATDADGKLVDVVDSYVAPVDPRAPSGEVFTARTTVDSQWLGTLGTYYWRGYYTADDGDVYATPIQRLVVTERPLPDPPSEPAPSPPLSTLPASPAPVAPLPAPAPAPARAQLSQSSAKAIIARTIRSRTRRSAQKLTTSCSLPSETAARCTVSWRDARYRYRATARVTSTTTGVLVKLDGTRTRRACSQRPCRRAIHWSVATSLPA
jgi:hypothetical protein